MRVYLICLRLRAVTCIQGGFELQPRQPLPGDRLAGQGERLDDTCAALYEYHHIVVVPSPESDGEGVVVGGRYRGPKLGGIPQRGDTPSWACMPSTRSRNITILAQQVMRSVCCSHDGRLLATASLDGRVVMHFL